MSVDTQHHNVVSFNVRTTLFKRPADSGMPSFVCRTITTVDKSGTELETKLFTYDLELFAPYDSVYDYGNQ